MFCVENTNPWANLNHSRVKWFTEKEFSSVHKLAPKKQDGKFFCSSLCILIQGQKEVCYAQIYPALATAGGRMSATKG